MSYSISTLLTRNLHDVFGENDPARRRARLTKCSPKIACSTILREASTEAATRSIESRAVKATHPDFRYQPIAEPEEVGNGGRVQWVSGRLVRSQHTLVLISSLPGTADCRRLSFFDKL